jgi:hypothetical protein
MRRFLLVLVDLASLLRKPCIDIAFDPATRPGTSSNGFGKVPAAIMR